MPITFYFRKLVRDDIVNNCLIDPKVLETIYRTLNDTDYSTELLKKVIEESAEIPPKNDTDNRKALSEIADLQSVIDAYANIMG